LMQLYDWFSSIDDLCGTLILVDNEIVSICMLDQMKELNTLADLVEVAKDADELVLVGVLV
nr:hypothetical protein [Tanacetum cinerariifolium]